MPSGLDEILAPHISYPAGFIQPCTGISKKRQGHKVLVAHLFHPANGVFYCLLRSETYSCCLWLSAPLLQWMNWHYR